jgi:hypothetical protein
MAESDETARAEVYHIGQQKGRFGGRRHVFSVVTAATRPLSRSPNKSLWRL